MKTRYMLILFAICLIINLISLYNIGLAYISFFFFVHVLVTRLYVKIILTAEEKEKVASKPLTKFIVAYGNHAVIRILNWISIIIGLIVLVFGAILIIATQIILKDEFSYFLYETLQLGEIDSMLQIVSYIGYIIFVFSIVIVEIDGIKILKKERLFQIE